jgi:hypothetical protein
MPAGRPGGTLNEPRRPAASTHDRDCRRFDLDAMSELLAVAGAARRPAGPRIGVVTASGGQAELILDVASAAGIDLPPLGLDIRRKAEEVIGPLTGDGNPLDAWGNGDFTRNFNVPSSYASNMNETNPRESSSETPAAVTLSRGTAVMTSTS